GGPRLPSQLPCRHAGVERGLERRDELLKLGERQAREIQELHRAGLELGEPYTSYGSCLLSQSCDVRGASYQKESGINSIIQRQVRLYLRAHDQQIPGNKGATATPTAAVVLALFAQVALVRVLIGDQEVEQVYGVQPHHLLLCDALDLDYAWYKVPLAQKNGRCIQTPLTWDAVLHAVRSDSAPAPPLVPALMPLGASAPGPTARRYSITLR